MLLLEGVRPGTYTIAAFANAERQQYTALVPGQSVPGDLRLSFEYDTPHVSADPVLHHFGRYSVQRGAVRVRSMPLDKLYCRMEVTVHGADGIDRFSVRFNGAPSGYDCWGRAFGLATYVPALRTEGGILKGTFFIPRFGLDSRVGMTLLAGTLELAAMPLSDYLREHDVHIDFSARDLTIPIDIRLDETHATIVVNGWDEEAIQLPILGH